MEGEDCEWEEDRIADESRISISAETRTTEAGLSNFDSRTHCAMKRVFWDASRRRQSHPEAEKAEIRNLAEIRNPAFLPPP